MRQRKREDIFWINRLTECSCIMHLSPAALAHKGNAGSACKSFITTGLFTLSVRGGLETISNMLPPSASTQTSTMLTFMLTFMLKMDFKRENIWDRTDTVFIFLKCYNIKTSGTKVHKIVHKLFTYMFVCLFVLCWRCKIKSKQKVSVRQTSGELSSVLTSFISSTWTAGEEERFISLVFRLTGANNLLFCCHISHTMLW